MNVACGRQAGVSLIEVLVAVLVFGVGLLGLAGLSAAAARSATSAAWRSQAVALAADMIERMRVNGVGVWMGAYDGDYPNARRQDCHAGCDPPQLAAYDGYRWSRQLAEALPAGAKASIRCDRGGAGYDPAAAGRLAQRPPFGGVCQMRLSWSERGAGDERHRQAANRMLAWTFQP